MLEGNVHPLQVLELDRIACSGGGQVDDLCTNVGLGEYDCYYNCLPNCRGSQVLGRQPPPQPCVGCAAFTLSSPFGFSYPLWLFLE